MRFLNAFYCMYPFFNVELLKTYRWGKFFFQMIPYLRHHPGLFVNVCHPTFPSVPTTTWYVLKKVVYISPTYSREIKRGITHTGLLTSDHL